LAMKRASAMKRALAMKRGRKCAADLIITVDEAL
jgi:hypothetical protein